MKLNVLITSAGSTPSQILARNLVLDERVGSVHLADMKKFNECPTPHILKDKVVVYHQVPNSKSEMYKNVILDIVESNEIDFIVPTFNDDILSLHGSIDSQKLMTTEFSPIFCNKRVAAEYFSKEKIPQPKFYTGNQEYNELDFPLITKPFYGMGGSDNIIIRSWDELSKFTHLGMWKTHLVQKYIEGGKEYTTDVVCSRDGSILGMCTRERIETRNGLCIIAEVVDIPEINEWVKIICDKFKFYGQINIQCIIKQINKTIKDIYFIEINPRPAGSASISYCAGLPIASMIIDAYLGEKRYYPKDLMYGLRMLRYWDEVCIWSRNL